MQVNNGKTIAKSKDYEGSTVTLKEVQSRGILHSINEYGYQMVYVVIIDFVFDKQSIFIYTDKVTAFRMFQRFLVK